jgi:Uma2 family endonuclease
VVEFAIPEIPREWSVEDLGALPQDGHRYEIVDACLHISPPPDAAHQATVEALGTLLRLAAPPHMRVLGRVGVASGRSLFVPDLVVLDAAVARAGAAVVGPGDVLLAAEVSAPATASMDRLLKPACYAQAGIPAYWLVEPGAGGPGVVVHDLAGDRYRQVAAVVAGAPAELDRPFHLVLDPALLASARG